MVGLIIVKKIILDSTVQICVTLYNRICEGLKLSASEFIVSGFSKKQTEIFQTPEQAENI